MGNNGNACKIFTAGYEGRSLAAFIGDLRARGVLMLADVREAPVSRKPGFSKNALAEALRQAGIEYRHIRALGCPKSIRDAYKEDGDWSRYTRAFMKHLKQQRGAIDDLGKLCAEQPTALLCYEADYTRCHRTYVARALANPAAVIWHITADGLKADQEA